MIKLHSRHCLVTAPDGTVHSLDVEALRRDLRQSFHSCGVSEDWAADHIALVIEEHASGTGTQRPPLAERDVHAMVAALLSASGYDDVGRQYRQMVPVAARHDDPDPFRPWDRNRVEAELAGLLPVDDRERTALVSRTASALAGLGLSVVRSELVHELGRHFLRQAAEAPGPGNGDSPWLLPPGGWPLGAVPGAERLSCAGVIRPHPVSRFLPRVHLELDLMRLAVLAGNPPLPEIVLLPALAQALDRVASLLTQTRRALDGLCPAGAIPDSHVVVHGLEATVTEAVLPQSPRAAKSLRLEIRAIVAAKLAAGGNGTVYATFR